MKVGLLCLLPFISYVSSTYVYPEWNWNWKDTALAVLQGSVNGVIRFQQLTGGRCTLITGTIKGLTPNKKHGIHIHQYGDLGKDCKSAGSHFNPYRQNIHGGPRDDYRHVGDLGNIRANENGVGKFYLCDKLVKLHNYPHVIGRSIVIHENVDDLGRTRAKDSKKTGNAGGRIGCGVIGWARPKEE